MTTTACPTPAPRAVPASPPPPAAARPSAFPSSAPGAWRYACPRRSRLRLFAAIAISGMIHVALFVGLKGHRKPAPKPADDHLLAVTFVIPPLKELEDPEPVRDSEDSAAKPDLGSPAPMLADLPQVPNPGDFVQPIDFSTLVERPDITTTKVWTIPEHILRGTRPGKGAGNIFNLSDLDRIPEPVMQPAPIYPPTLRREGLVARVVVEFVVDTHGQVQSPVVVESSHPGFDDAATLGVQKWRFRAGQRGGQKVNTRMSVPIVFRTTEGG